MESPFQQRSLQRKLIYLGMILVLFTGSYLFMHRSFAVPVLGWEFRSVITQAEDLALREQNIGDVELTGAAVRLNLTGLRGLAVCALWNTAMEKQKKNQWNELELIVRSVTKLQPHLITPWLFQSWNLAYNVSVESDREGDQFFYITRGIELLAEGERQNHNHPDLRWAIAFYNQNKIGQSDKANVLKSLYQMTCIPPNERDPARFKKDDGTGTGQMTIDLVQFEDFCKNHPQLVRRLRQELRLSTPERVVQFLDENYAVPCLYEDVKKAVPGAWKKSPEKLRPMADRFPILPPQHDVAPPQQLFDPTELTAEKPELLRDDFNAWICARAWYGYAQEPLPPPGEFPGLDGEITDRTKQRKPKFTTAIFRNYPARAQTFAADSLEKEGWFDTKGWQITGWFVREDDAHVRKDQFQNGSLPIVGADRSWAVDAWRQAFKMWKEHGERNKLLLTPQEEQNFKDDAKFYMDEYHMQPGNIPIAVNPSREERRSPEEREKMKNSHYAFSYGYWYVHYRMLTNFAHFYLASQTEMDENTVAARKAFFEARQLYTDRADREGARKNYEESMGPGLPSPLVYWRGLLVDEKFGNDAQVQDDSYRIQLRYLRILRELTPPELKQAEAIQAFLGESAAAGAPSWLTLSQFCRRPPLTPQPEFTGPFEGQTKSGFPIIPEQVRNSVNLRYGIGPKPLPGPPPGPMSPGMPTIGQ